jgi:hypothetical protein
MVASWLIEILMMWVKEAAILQQQPTFTMKECKNIFILKKNQKSRFFFFFFFVVLGLE